MRATWRVTLAISIVVLVGTVLIHVNDSPSLASTPAVLPNTAAGKRAAAYIDAFNSGSDSVMLDFEDKNRSLRYLERLNVDERLGNYKRLRGIFGHLTPLRVAFSLELQITLLMNCSRTDDVLVVRIQLEEDTPHRLHYMTFSGIDRASVPDDYVAYVATRAAPVDDSLRETTIQGVADILGSRYIYPELGNEMKDTILRNRMEGKYADCKKAGKLADMLTEDLVAASNDRHIWVEAQNPMAQGLKVRRIL